MAGQHILVADDDRTTCVLMQAALAKAILSPSFQSAFNVVKGSVPARTDVSDEAFLDPSAVGDATDPRLTIREFMYSSLDREIAPIANVSGEQQGRVSGGAHHLNVRTGIARSSDAAAR